MNKNSKIRVLVADDHPAICHGLKQFINTEPDMEAVAEAYDGQAVLELVTRFQPHVTVLDLLMPKLNGSEIADRLQTLCPSNRVLIYTGSPTYEHARAALQAGARGYIQKLRPLHEVIQAIRSVAKGMLYLEPALAAVLIAPPANGVGLDAHDEDVHLLKLAASGHSNKEIAEELNIRLGAVESRKHRALAKFQLKSRRELITHALEQGWLGRNNTVTAEGFPSL